MTNQSFATISFVGSIAIYCIASTLISMSVVSRQDYYHGVRSLHSSIVSLVCVQITLGTGVAYVLSQASISSFLTFLTPIGILLGYWIAGIWSGLLNYQSDEKIPNIHQLLKRDKDKPVMTLSNFASAAYTLMIILTFVLLIGYELWLSTKYITSLLFIEVNPQTQITVSIILFLVVAGYTTISGIRGAVGTDIVQSFFIIAFLIAIVFALYKFDLQAGNVKNPDQHYFKLDSLSFSAAILGLITAVTTQLYNVVNSKMAGDLLVADQKKLFYYTGIITSLFYSIIIFVGVTYTASEDLSIVFKWLLNGPNQPFLIIFLMAGMLAILMSTIDSAIIVLSNLVYENMFDGNSFQQDGDKEASVLRKLKYATFFGSLLIYGFTLCLIVFAPNAFFTLLNILFVTTIVTPIVMSSMRLHASRKSSLIDRTHFGILIVLATLLAWGGYISLSLYGERIYAVWYHIGCFSIAMSVAYVDWRLGSRSSQVR